ncbi:coiled-coil and C2 domain-containing protein 1A-like, partial [Zonotrichia leucophrys gambelii]|uniref:coiled-coil and C2 domain-containing protein 1A-like n=1 Tax=Zonotrichia leucophrys gambelii TaxID=257770 RepID=UPI003140AC94
MSRAGRVPGRGAAMARQLGLLAAPGAGGNGNGNGNGDGDGEAALEAELLRLLRGRDGPESGQRPPPTDVQALAQLCLQDPPEEEEGEEDLENEELMAELQEVLQEGPESTESAQDPAGALLAELSERAELYRAAIANAGTGNGSTGTGNGNAARLRRLQRGLKTLEQLLASAHRGIPIDRAEIPPPVALGRPGGSPLQPPAPNPPLDPHPDPKIDPNPKIDPRIDPRIDPDWRRLRELQREALQAKRSGDKATALSHFREAKKLQAQLEALGRGAEPDPQAEESKDPPTKDPPKKDQLKKDQSEEDQLKKDQLKKDQLKKDQLKKDQLKKDQPEEDPAISSP